MKKENDTTNYDKTHYRQFVIKLGQEKDSELVKYIESQPNINAYLRELVISDMNKSVK